jgi:hypothetical protein
MIQQTNSTIFEVLSDAAIHFEHGLRNRCDMEPRSVERSCVE